MLMAEIEVFNEDCIKISHAYLLYFSRNKPSKCVTVGSGRLIALNDSASPKMVIKMYLHFFRFILKVLELFECLNPLWKLNVPIERTEGELLLITSKKRFGSSLPVMVAWNVHFKHRWFWDDARNPSFLICCLLSWQFVEIQKIQKQLFLYFF